MSAVTISKILPMGTVVKGAWVGGGGGLVFDKLCILCSISLYLVIFQSSTQLGAAW